MNTLRIRRLYYIILLILGTCTAVALVFFALGQNVHLFFTTTEIRQGQAPIGPRIRIGGMVEAGSIHRNEGLEIQFKVTDYKNTVTVQYTGILPDLFREKQGIVASGRLKDAEFFIADEVLAKHDEKYMPSEIAKKINKDCK